MNILYYDCFAGISGDMNLAAMLGLGVPADHLRRELSRLGIDDEFSLEITHDQRKGIHGTRVNVHTHNHHDHQHEDNNHSHSNGQSQSQHSCSNIEDIEGYAKNDHAHNHADHHEHHHAQRNFRDIAQLINASDLSQQVKETSLAIFRRVAEAEAKIHGKDIDKVHFHEVGATDSIVDIVGAAICFHALDIAAVWCSPVELGGGFVRCAHGLIPVPAPATVEILRGVPTKLGAVQKETTTPTGAAILAELVDRFGKPPEMTVSQTAYGIGHRDTEIPNVLRVSLATVEEKRMAKKRMQEQQGQQPLKTMPCCLLECNIDDMTGEMLGDTMDRLMEEGAMDVHFTSIVMKKNRPAVTLSVLCHSEEEERFKRFIFRHTTTLGIKTIPLRKTVLDVSFETLETPLGSVTMKNGIMDGEIIRSKPEFEDCRKLANKHRIPLSEVYLQVGKVRKS